MVCHEVWDYDDAGGCATLRRFRLICPDCNFVTHRGMAGNLGLADHAEAHMVAVNGITLDEARRLYDVAYSQWSERSARDWTVRIDEELVTRHPVLADVDLTPDESPGITSRRPGPARRRPRSGRLP